jgi:hypothetical protein
MNRSVNGQLSYILAYNQKPKFEEFFTTLDKNKEMLGVESYGISDTTLEEVFINFLLFKFKLFNLKLLSFRYSYS